MIDFEKIQEDVDTIKKMVAALSSRIDQSGEPVDEVLTIQQASELLRLGTQTIYGLVSARKIPFSKPTGSRLYFSRLELLAWLKSNRTATVQERTQAYEQGRTLPKIRKGGRKIA